MISYELQVTDYEFCRFAPLTAKSYQLIAKISVTAVTF
jgi:hypothetical protein